MVQFKKKKENTNWWNNSIFSKKRKKREKNTFLKIHFLFDIILRRKKDERIFEWPNFIFYSMLANASSVSLIASIPY